MIRAFSRLASLAALCIAPAIAGDSIAIKAGTVLTMTGAPIQDGIVLIADGRVVAVGSADEVEIPWDAVLLDMPDMVAAPGFVEAHTSRGMDRANESLDVAPFLDVNDSVDPVNFYFEECLRSGITTVNVQQGNDTVIAGQGMVVKPYGMTVDQMLVRPKAGVKISMSPKRGKSRATQAMLLRQAFGDLRRELEKLVAEKKAGSDRARREALAQGRDLEGENAKGRAMEGKAWKVEGLEMVPRGEIDEKYVALLAIVEGRMPVYLNCSSAADVHRGLQLARENGFLERTTLVLGTSAWKAADAIKDAGVSVVVDSDMMHTERDPITDEETKTFVPKVLHDKGIPFALSSENGTTESLWYQAALCVGQGLDREDALRAITTAPAQMLGLGERVGTLSPGADGDVVLYTGDPLSVTSVVQQVVLGGKVIYDRSNDHRARYLLEGVQPEGTSFIDAETVEDVHAEEAKAGEGDK